MKVIKITTTKDINQLLDYGKEQAKSYKGNFKGDRNNGIFDFHALGSRFKGNYIVKKNSIEITFEKKPFFISLNAIESFLKKHLT